MAIPKSLVSSPLAVSILLVLSACSEPPKCEAKGPNDDQVGRYRVHHVPGTREVIEIDTATGKTWRLLWSGSDESLVPYAWEDLDD